MRFIAALLVLLAASSSYAEKLSRYNARVMHAFLVFTPARTLQERSAGLEIARARDRFLLLRGDPRDEQAMGFGALMLGVTTIMTAHAPQSLRPLFDGPVHLGPAVFDGGGLGAGIGLRWM
jgi:hypothetical protein